MESRSKMDKQQYLSKLVSRIKISFYILLVVSIYELLYFLNNGGSLSFVLLLLSGAVTFFAYTLMQLFTDMKNNTN